MLLLNRNPCCIRMRLVKLVLVLRLVKSAILVRQRASSRVAVTVPLVERQALISRPVFLAKGTWRVQTVPVLKEW